MLTSARRLGVAALAMIALLGLEVPTGQAQVAQPNPQNVPNPYFRVPNTPLNQAPANPGVFGQAVQGVPPWVYGNSPYSNPVNSYPYPAIAGSLSSTPFGAGYGMAGSLYSNNSGYGGGSGYNYSPYGYYFQDPFSGYLTGAASVISAQAQFMTSQAQTDLLREQRRQMQIDTHRKIMEEWMYERNLLANVPDPRDVERRFALHRALNDPPMTEILTGDALNAILANVKKLLDKGGVGPTLMLDEDMLRDINVSSGERGNIGLFKKNGRLTWPLSLQGEMFEGERKRVEQLAQDAVKQVEFQGKVDAGTMQQLLKDSAALHERLSKSVHDLTPTQYVDARRYLNQLDEALTALQQPDVQNYFNKKWQAKGRTVGDLVKFMGDTGLRFNSATQGNEGAYRMLQQRLTAYNMALEQQLANR